MTSAFRKLQIVTSRRTSSLRNIDIFLRENGIKPSYQRKRIYEFMYENRIHPTVNMIYQALIHEIPTLSKATVYNTMNLFDEQGRIDVIPIEGNESRFDIRPQKPHAHFKCDACLEIFDVEIEIPEQIISEKLAGCEISNQNINFTGTCSRCIEGNQRQAV